MDRSTLLDSLFDYYSSHQDGGAPIDRPQIDATALGRQLGHWTRRPTRRSDTQTTTTTATKKRAKESLLLLRHTKSKLVALQPRGFVADLGH